MLISLSRQDEQLVRKWAKQSYGGKKGSISAFVADAVHALVQHKREQDRRIAAANRVLADMNEGFDSDFRGGRAYEKREDIYAGRLRKFRLD